MNVHLNEVKSEVARDLILTLMKYDSPLLKHLCHYVKKTTGNDWPQATLRCTLQRHCKNASQYNENNPNLFEHLTNGCWRLRPEVKVQV